MRCHRRLPVSSTIEVAPLSRSGVSVVTNGGQALVLRVFLGSDDGDDDEGEGGWVKG